MENIDVISMVRREVKRNHMSNTELARRLYVFPASVQGMFSRPTMQVQRLVQLSEIFQYNFFREIARMIPYADPDYTVKTGESPVEIENAQLKDRIKALEMEVGILRQTLKDVVSK